MKKLTAILIVLLFATGILVVCRQCAAEMKVKECALQCKRVNATRFSIQNGMCSCIVDYMKNE